VVSQTLVAEYLAISQVSMYPKNNTVLMTMSFVV